ncbi:hypothetical protein H2204_005595 [Knufia peltigerae]|uniref:C2H2-type domain-containing protein n=1 Tax=Knufia peltigerae TaxID=1002370 RepID=A0AA39CYG4_9EURO|nr:hypothetical protein H2204_005595 [Knufia peltigerae]
MQSQDRLGGVPEYLRGHYGGYPAPSSWDGSDDNSCIDPQLRSLQHEYPYHSLETFHVPSQTYAGRYFTAYDLAAHGFDQSHKDVYEGHLYHHSFPDLLPGIIDEHRQTRQLSPSANTPSSTGSSSSDFGFSPDALRFPQEPPLAFESPLSAHSPPGMPTTPQNVWAPHYPIIIPSVAATPGGNLALSMRDLQVTLDPEDEESFINCDRDQIPTKIQLPQELELSEQLASPSASSMFDEDEEMLRDSGKSESDNDSDFVPDSAYASRRGPAALRHSLRSPRQQKPKAINDPQARIHKTSTTQDHALAMGRSRLKAKKIFPQKRSHKSKSFPCSFHHYGCPAVFSSKNEWKRHVSSQHVRLGFYRCDLGACSSEFAPHQHRGYNDFNRKDLFTQHCRRMHAPWGTKDKTMEKVSKKEKDNFEKELGQIRARCWVEARKPPEKTKCGFCDKKFIEGQGQNGSVIVRAWDQRMEHMGKHYEKDGFVAKDERVDLGLQGWALREGVIRQAKTTNRYLLVGLEPAQINESNIVPMKWRRSVRVVRRRGGEDDDEGEEEEKEERESSVWMELDSNDEYEDEEDEENSLKAPDAEAD